MPKTRVGHWKADETDIYAGRGPGGRDMTETPTGERGWLGNPYSVEEFDRHAAIQMFRIDFLERLVEDETFRAAVRDLAGQTLGCWCQRLDEDDPACHAEIVADAADVLADHDPGVIDEASEILDGRVGESA